MTFKTALWAISTVAAAAALLAGVAPAVHAGFLTDDTGWTEIETPPPPAFDVKKLVPLEIARSSPMVYGIDPASMSISKQDGVLRYVMVITSPTGVRNIIYEGIRCASAEFKTYARYGSNGTWNQVSEPKWRSLYDRMPAPYPLEFAKMAACDSASPRLSVNEIVNLLKKSAATGDAY